MIFRQHFLLFTFILANIGITVQTMIYGQDQKLCHCVAIYRVVYKFIQVSRCTQVRLMFEVLSGDSGKAFILCKQDDT